VDLVNEGTIGQSTSPHVMYAQKLSGNYEEMVKTDSVIVVT